MGLGIALTGKCGESWGRDFNASRNIFYMFESLMKTNKPAPYLKRKRKETKEVKKNKKSKADQT